jgi:hypothetical protein
VLGTKLGISGNPDSEQPRLLVGTLPLAALDLFLVGQSLVVPLTAASVNPLPPSRPGEFHPEALTDPDVNLSIHPARATQ